jgi:hypothetical protein
MMRTIVSLMVLLGLSSILQAEEPVHFGDPVLKAAVEAELWISGPTPTDMLALTELRCACTITDLTGLEYATNVETISLGDKNWLVKNGISDLTPLAGLIALRVLDLACNNQIRDISPLSGLTNLRELDLERNHVSDISPLSGLSSLQSLSLHRNDITDLSPLEALTGLQWLDVRLNPLDHDAWSIHIPRIIANNPGLDIWYDASYLRYLVISSTAGGSVVSPGEGDFTYEYEETVLLEAKADPYFVFDRWTGSFPTRQNPLSVTMSRREFDRFIRANFLSVLEVIHVDDDASPDPGPTDPAVSGPQENGTHEHPFDCIQDAIEVADDGATVFVHGGTYQESISLLGKRITLTGFDPNDPSQAAWPVIDGCGDAWPVVSFTGGEDPRCLLRGFIVTASKAGTVAAIECSASSPTIANCLIVGNRVTGSHSAAVHCANSNAVLVNCTIADNHADSGGAMLRLENSSVQVVNSILWGNVPNRIVATGGTPSIRYSCIAGGWAGLGNIDADPLFVRCGRWVSRLKPELEVAPGDADAVWVTGDYHLQSQVGRWDSSLGQWVQDAVTSPCIDAGDPASDYSPEPMPNGGRINMGAYGGTSKASKSP